MDRSMCLSEELHAKTSPWPESERDSTENDPVSPKTLLDSLTSSMSKSASGKTSPALSLPIRAEIFQLYYPCLRDAKLSPPSGEDLIQPDLFSPLEKTDSEWHGECWTLALSERPDSLGASPSDAEDSSLSDILEAGPVPQRYYLKERALNGIIRRSEKRKRPLPEALKKALKQILS